MAKHAEQNTTTVSVELTKAATAALDIYKPTVKSKEEVEKELHKLGAMLERVANDVEGTLTSQACVLVADFVYFQYQETKVFPAEKIIKPFVLSAMGMAENIGGKVSKGTISNVVALSIRAGILVFLNARTTFAVCYQDPQTKARLSLEPIEGAPRFIGHRKNAVYPNRKEGKGDKAFPVPETDMYVYASTESINLAFSYYVNGISRDEYGRPKRGQTQGQDVKLSDASPDKLFMRADAVARSMKPSADNKEMIRSLRDTLSEQLGEEAEGVEVVNKIELTGADGLKLSIGAVVNCLIGDLMDETLHTLNNEDQEALAQLYRMLRDGFGFGAMEAEQTKRKTKASKAKETPVAVAA